MQSLVLESYGTSELSFDEQRETDGGIWPIVAAAVVALGEAAGWASGAIAGDIVMNWDSAVAAVNKGYNQTRKH
jgi:hypothetical protein